VQARCWLSSSSGVRRAVPFSDRSSGKTAFLFRQYRRLLRRFTTVCYTVQSSASAGRLRSTGSPWPTGELRAHLGLGVYSWATRTDATDHFKIRLARGQNVIIVRFRIANCVLRRFRYLDLGDIPNADVWLSAHSLQWNDNPARHGLQYIRRPVGFRADPPAIEHYFHASVFWFLWFC
jgi:hypothetical protein